jgi:hypothetical protein
VATPDWLAIVNDEINLWLNPRVLTQIDRDTQGLAVDHEIIYRINSLELLQVLASSMGMAACRQGAIAIWTYYTEVNSSPNSSTKPSPILRTLMNIDGDLSQKVCADILQHPQADRLFKAHSFLVSQISLQLITAIDDYIEEKLRPFSIAIASFLFTITWQEPLQKLAKQFKVPEALIAPLANQGLAIAIAAPIVVLLIWWISAKLKLTLPTIPKTIQQFGADSLKLLESPFFQIVAIAVVITLVFCAIAIKWLIPANSPVNNFVMTAQSWIEPYLPVAIISLRKGIIGALGKIFLRYPIVVKWIFGRFVR